VLLVYLTGLWVFQPWRHHLLNSLDGACNIVILCIVAASVRYADGDRESRDNDIAITSITLSFLPLIAAVTHCVVMVRQLQEPAHHEEKKEKIVHSLQEICQAMNGFQQAHIAKFVSSLTDYDMMVLDDASGILAAGLFKWFSKRTVKTGTHRRLSLEAPSKAANLQDVQLEFSDIHQQHKDQQSVLQHSSAGDELESESNKEQFDVRLPRERSVQFAIDDAQLCRLPSGSMEDNAAKLDHMPPDSTTSPTTDKGKDQQQEECQVVSGTEMADAPLEAANAQTMDAARWQQWQQMQMMHSLAQWQHYQYQCQAYLTPRYQNQSHFAAAMHLPQEFNHSEEASAATAKL